MKLDTAPDVVTDIDDVLRVWRTQIIDLILVVAAIVDLPVVILAVGMPHLRFSWGWRLFAAALYLGVVTLAALRRVDARLRMALLLLLGYTMAAAGLARAGLAGVGRTCLLGLPIMALVTMGARAGWAATGLTLSLYAAFCLFTSLGLLARWTAVPDNPLDLGFWIAQGAMLVGFLVPAMVLLDRSLRLQTETLAAERRTSARLGQEIAERAAGHEALRREVAERQRLEREVAAVGDEERRQLGQEIHDGVCQELTGALLRCHALGRRLAQGGALQPSDLHALGLLLEEAIGDAHEIARGLSPLERHAEALAPALRLLAARTQESTGLACQFCPAGDVRVPDSEQAHHLYRIAQEAVSNTVRHARSARIALELRGSDGEILLRVEDDGTGLPEDTPGEGMGLRIMAYRAQMMGGTLAIERGPEGGTRITCRVPRGGTPEPEGVTDER